MTTARDDYQYGEHGAQHFTMCDEIDSLRRWKAEALLVLASWENVSIAAGCPGPLGASKADSVRRLFERRPNPPEKDAADDC